MGLRLTGGQHPKHFPDLVGGAWLRVADVQITNASLVTIAMAVVLTVAAELFLARTRTGLELRALSERPMAAELLGIRVRLLALGVWAVAGAVTSFALMLIAPLRSPDFASLSLLVVPALAAALVGAFRSFRAALAGGLLIGVVEGLASGLVGLNQYRAAVPLLVILLVLLWSQRGARWDEAR
jgi:branched-chain amino acid transport system permease protein